MSCMEESREWTPREREWNLFLLVLQPWELHWLCQGDRELKAHDSFLAGDIELEGVHAIIRESLPVPSPALAG